MCCKKQKWWLSREGRFGVTLFLTPTGSFEVCAPLSHRRYPPPLPLVRSLALEQQGVVSAICVSPALSARRAVGPKKKNTRFHVSRFQREDQRVYFKSSAINNLASEPVERPRPRPLPPVLSTALVLPLCANRLITLLYSLTLSSPLLMCLDVSDEKQNLALCKIDGTSNQRMFCMKETISEHGRTPFFFSVGGWSSYFFSTGHFSAAIMYVCAVCRDRYLPLSSRSRPSMPLESQPGRAKTKVHNREPRREGGSLSLVSCWSGQERRIPARDEAFLFIR